MLKQIYHTALSAAEKAAAKADKKSKKGDK